MRVTLRVWRQTSTDAEGRLVTYDVDDVSPDMSFLEMLDVLNERLILDGEAKRDDERFCNASVWEHRGDDAPKKNVEPLVFENVKLATRSYK